MQQSREDAKERQLTKLVGAKDLISRRFSWGSCLVKKIRSDLNRQKVICCNSAIFNGKYSNGVGYPIHHVLKQVFKTAARCGQNMEKFWKNTSENRKVVRFLLFSTGSGFMSTI